MVVISTCSDFLFFVAFVFAVVCFGEYKMYIKPMHGAQTERKTRLRNVHRWLRTLHPALQSHISHAFLCTDDEV